jgi:predicted dehydrogenase
MEKRPRIGVVGTGWWATHHHIPGLLGYDGVELAALADTDEAKLGAVAAHFGIERTFADPQALFTSGLVDGVMIVVPHAYHYPLARAALDAGLHVFVEKPMVLRAREAWDLVRTAAGNGLHLTVGYTFHFTTSAQRCRETVQSGRIGELILVSGLFSSMVEQFYRGQTADAARGSDAPVTGPDTTTYADPRIAGGGQAQTQITHPMGMVCWVTDRRVLEVAAFMETRDLAVDLADAIAYRFEGGAAGTMSSTGSLRPGQAHQQEIRYYGTAGFVLQDLVTAAVEIHLNDGTSEVMSPAPPEQAYLTHAPGRGFADLIAGRGENLAPPVPAAHTVEFLEATYRSAQLGRPVRIAELTDPKHDAEDPWR